jgi:hypothetical protein
MPTKTIFFDIKKSGYLVKIRPLKKEWVLD